MRELLTFSIEEKAYPRPALVSSRGSASVRYDTRNGIADRYQQYKSRIRGAARAALPAGWEPVEGAVEARIVIERERLKTDPDRVWKITTPDTENLIKPIIDAHTDLVFVDDRQVVSIAVAETYGPVDLLTIQFNLLDDSDTDTAVPYPHLWLTRPF